MTATVFGVLPSDKRGNMFDFDGSDYIFINDVAEDITGSDEFTFEAWINPTSSGNKRSIISVNTSTGGNEYLFFLESGILRTFDGSNKDTYGADIRGTGWHHVAVSHDGTTDRVYLDGVLLGTNTASVNTFAADNQWSIGQEFDGSSKTDKFDGQMDEVRIWKDVRTQNEIQNYKNVTFTTAQVLSFSNLVSYYQFDSDDAPETANGVKDILGNHGTSTGGTYSASEVAVGGGTTEMQSVTASGLYNFNTVGVDLRFIVSGGESFPNGDVAITKITTEAPNTAATGKLANEPTAYWIINNYGTNTNLNADVTFKFGDGAISDAVIG